MKKFVISIIIIFLFLGLFFLKIIEPIKNKNQQQILLNKWIDGDTFTYTDENKVLQTARLVNVDTPELKNHSNQFETKSQQSVREFYAQEALKTVKTYFPENHLYQIKTFGVDTYDRIIVNLNKNATSAEELLLKKGLARLAYWWIEPNYFQYQNYLDVMANAGKNFHGFWDFVLNDNFDIAIIPTVARQNYLRLKNQNVHPEKKLISWVFENWIRDHDYYPVSFLNQFNI